MIDLATLVAATLELTGTRMSDDGLTLLIRRLEREDPDRVRRALERCAEECRYRLTLADILQRMPSLPPARRALAPPSAGPSPVPVVESARPPPRMRFQGRAQTMKQISQSVPDAVRALARKRMGE